MLLKLKNLTVHVDPPKRTGLRIFLFALIVGLTMVLSACGGDGGVSSNSLAGGGIGGTGEGTVTGYGSVIINVTRRFGITSSTRITIDGNPASEQDLRDLGTGLVAVVDVADDVNGDFTSGTAVEISVLHKLKGPVTQRSPELEVLGQKVLVTGDTVLELPISKTIGTLAIGDIVEISGFSDPANIIQATRREYKATGTPVWKITGPVSVLTATTFDIGSQTVDITGITPRDCGAGLAEGNLVKVKAAENAGFVAGNTLTGVTSIECFQPGLKIPDGVTGNQLEAEVEGLVDSVLLPSFIVNGQKVTTTDGTVYEDGAFEDIVEGAKLEAEGSLDISTGVLTAEKIRFRTARVRIRGPVGTIDPGQSLVVLGITVFVTPLTDDRNGTVASAKFTGQVEVRGFSDSAGQVYASRISEIGGGADPTNVKLRGQITAIPKDPAIDPVFEILNVKIDTTDTVKFFDANDQHINSGQFFAAIEVGMQVEVEGGEYDSKTGAITNADTISIED